MRGSDFTKLVVSASWLLIGGCEVARPAPNPARVFATGAAGQAGRFHLQNGRWPTDMKELEDFMCRPSDDADPAALHCEDMERSNYHADFESRGADLRMDFFDAASEPVCSLTVRAPPGGEPDAAYPKIVIQTNVFACPGEKK